MPANLTEEDDAYVDLFGYSIDSCRVTNATDPYYGESSDLWPEKDEYDLAHYGTDHSWGCTGAGRWTDIHYRGFKAYVSNYYDVIELTSRLQAILPKQSWSDSRLIKNGGGQITKTVIDHGVAKRVVINQSLDPVSGEMTVSEDKANLYAIAGKPVVRLNATAYFDPDKSDVESAGAVNPAGLDGAGAKAFWGEDGAAYRFQLGNSGRLMFESELRIGTKSRTAEKTLTLADGTIVADYDTKDYTYEDGSYNPSHTLPGGSVAYSAVPMVPTDEEVEIYENAVRGFQTKRLMLSPDLVAGADIKEIEITYFPRPAAGSSLPLAQIPVPERITLSASDVQAYRQLNGAVVIPWTAWGQGYFTNAVVRFNRIGVNLGVDSDGSVDGSAFVDVWGEATDVRDMPLNAWFGCTYPEEGYHYSKNEPTWPYGTNRANYAYGTWCNSWPNGTADYNGRTWTSGYTRVGDFVKYVSSVDGYTPPVYDKKLPESSYDKRYMPQMERQVANYQDMWVGGNVASAGTVTSYIYGRPYNVNEGVSVETFMRSENPGGNTSWALNATTGVKETGKPLTVSGVGGTTGSYYEEDGSGYRFTLTNDNPNAVNQYDMRKAYFATEPIPFVENMVRKKVAEVVKKEVEVTDEDGNIVYEEDGVTPKTEIKEIETGAMIETDELVKSGEYVNFTTTDVVLSKALLEQSLVFAPTDLAHANAIRTNIKDFTIYFRPYDPDADPTKFNDASLDKSITFTSDEILALYKGTDPRTMTFNDPNIVGTDEEGNATIKVSAEGNIVINRAAWGGHFFRNVQMHLNHFKGGMTKDADATKNNATIKVSAEGNIVINRAAWGGHFFRNVQMHLNHFKGGMTKDADATKNAFVEFYGYGSNRWVDKTVYGTFRTDWVTDWWNTNNTADDIKNATNGSGSAIGAVRLNFDYFNNAPSGISATSKNYVGTSARANVGIKNFDN